MTLREDTEKADAEFRETLKKEMDECPIERMNEVYRSICARYKQQLRELFALYSPSLKSLALFAGVALFGSQAHADAGHKLKDVQHDHVDVTETNHFYDEDGKHVFDQIIYWGWHDAESDFRVRAWRLLKNQSQIPVNNTAIFHDGEILRKVTSSSSRETWTQYDPELVDRANLPREHRRDLSRPVICK